MENISWKSPGRLDPSLVIEAKKIKEASQPNAIDPVVESHKEVNDSDNLDQSKKFVSHIFSIIFLLLKLKLISRIDRNIYNIYEFILTNLFVFFSVFSSQNKLLLD